MSSTPAAITEGRHDVVVGLDVHDGWEQALDWAVDQAVREGRPLTIVHALDGPESIWRNPAGRDTRIGLLDSPAPARLFLDEARARAQARAPELMVHELLHSGGPREVLAEAASEAHLLVLGARHRHRVWPRLVGSVSASTARRPPCAVVVVHTDQAHRDRRGVLVGVDDAGGSRSALLFAFRQASLRGWPLTVMHVAPDPITGPGERLEVERYHLASAIAGASEEFPDVALRTSLQQGDPAIGLLRAGDAMGLVVVGAHHGRAISDLLIGSVVVPVVERSRCAVAVVPNRPG